MSMLTPLKTGGRAAVVALVLAASAISVVPAQAAGPNVNFSLSLGSGIGFGGNGIYLNFGNGPKMMCLSDKQIVWQLMDEGWKKPKIVKKLGPNKVVAVARWQGSWYQMRVDRCTGKVDKVRPVNYNTGNGNFSITLSF